MHDLLGDGKAIDMADGRLDIELEPLQGKIFIDKLKKNKRLT
jgi:hypothetical protein